MLKLTEGMDTVATLVIVIVLCCSSTINSTVTLPDWNMHQQCGQTISKIDRGGYLYLDADLLPAAHQSDCRVVIQPKPTGNSSAAGNHHVLFYFTSFEVGTSCEDTFLLVYDDNEFMPQGTRAGRKVIEGLNLPMCGANNYLNKDVTFTTQNNSFTVIFKRRQAGLYTKATFNLTFFSFFAGGTCETDDETLFKCNNNRCVDKTFICQNLNPCGDNSDDKPDCTKATVEDSGPTWIEKYMAVMDTIKIVIFVCTGVGFIICCIRWRCVRDCISDRFSRLKDWVIGLYRRMRRNVFS